jgi:hypothetical protein
MGVSLPDYTLYYKSRVSDSFSYKRRSRVAVGVVKEPLLLKVVSAIKAYA